MGLVVTPYALDAYLSLVAGRADPSEFIEVRRRTRGAMSCEFFAVSERDAAGAYILDHSRQTDVYVGCAPRTREAGTKDAIGQVWTLWAECDGAESVAALKAFE